MRNNSTWATCPTCPLGWASSMYLKLLSFLTCPPKNLKTGWASWEVPEFIGKLNLPTGKKLKGSRSPNISPL